MPPRPFSVLLVDPQSESVASRLRAAGFDVAQAPDTSAARSHDAVLLAAPTAEALSQLTQRSDLTPAAFDAAVIVLCPVAGDDAIATLMSLGVEDVLAVDDALLPRAVRHAVLRKRHERLARNAYATDLATGLPHLAQLLEHMTQLLALREREPAPMVLLVLRMDGYAGVATRLGAEAANILRRKVAVRLRSGLRAGDVVAAIGPDTFAVLLSHLEALGDGERVAAKLMRTLQLPLVVAGQACPVMASVGMALYPAHGKDAESLLRRATAQASSVATLGSQGFATSALGGLGGVEDAANDDAP